MAQAFTSREKYCENKVANFSRLIVTDSVSCFGFLISTNSNDPSDVVNE